MCSLIPSWLMWCAMLLHGNADEVKVQISAGAQWKELPDSTNYEATIPLTYVTEWLDTTALQRMPMIHSNECSVALNIKPGSFCEELLRLRKVGSDIDDYSDKMHRLSMMNLIHSARKYAPSDDELRRRRSLDFLGDALTWCCGVATQRKIDSLSMREQDLTKRMKIINQGMSTVLQEYTRRSEAFQNYARDNEDAMQGLVDGLRNVATTVNHTKLIEEERWRTIL